MNRDEMIAQAVDALHESFAAERRDAPSMGTAEQFQDSWKRWFWEDRVRAVLDAILPLVTTVEELETLPRTAVVVGADNSLWEKSEVGWLCAHGSDGWDRDAGQLLADHGPLTVAWSPA